MAKKSKASEIQADGTYFITQANGEAHLVHVEAITEDPRLGRKILCDKKVYVGNTGRRHSFFKGDADANAEFEVESPGGIMESAIVSWNTWEHPIPETR
jgi:hypothetical protein